MSENNSIALATYDSAPSMVIQPSESQKRYDELQKFIQNQMIPGVDYGVIPGTGDKPSLLKPGAEKLCAIYGYSIGVDILDKVLDWDGNFVSYEIKVTLRIKETGMMVAEGVGCCNSRERKYKTREAADMANTIIKIAKKRALVDSTLSATRSSGLFTQDIEDMELNGDASRQSGNPRQLRPAQSSAPSNAGDVPACNICSGGMYDNRSGKRNPKAPDFKCKDKSCDGAIWLTPKNGNNGNAQPAQRQAPTEHIEGEVVENGYFPDDIDAPPDEGQGQLAGVFAADDAARSTYGNNGR